PPSGRAPRQWPRSGRRARHVGLEHAASRSNVRLRYPQEGFVLQKPAARVGLAKRAGGRLARRLAARRAGCPVRAPARKWPTGTSRWRALPEPRRRPARRPCRFWPCAARKRRWYRAGTSGEICRAKERCARTHGLEIDVLEAGHGEQIDDARLLGDQAVVGLEGEQHVGRTPAVGDEDGAFERGFLGAPDVVVEFATRQSGVHRSMLLAVG